MEVIITLEEAATISTVVEEVHLKRAETMVVAKTGQGISDNMMKGNIMDTREVDIVVTISMTVDTTEVIEVDTMTIEIGDSDKVRVLLTSQDKTQAPTVSNTSNVVDKMEEVEATVEQEVAGIAMIVATTNNLPLAATRCQIPAEPPTDIEAEAAACEQLTYA